jgi:eukaryotic-like serine/threonine-protein kinase
VNTKIWQQIDSLFDEYLDASPEDQAVFLTEKCNDEDIRIELQKLISALNKTEDFIEHPTFTSVKKLLDEEPEDNLIGSKIFSYQIQKLLGKGGMGTVYLANRIDDFRKEVAIKVIPPFANSQANKDNFRRERQILARLEHPNIARILDGGTTETGTPFLVMEYVDGIPLNQFCEKLTVDERLILFQDVCKAVGYAHSNLIVHRDLKPTNILVTSNGTVKLLDFGIAKLLQAEDFDFSGNVTFSGNALTPDYASPEQINGENITIASDVYSLGVVLFEILTGQRPHDFKDKPLNEIMRIITKNEPLPPSLILNLKFQITDSKSEVDAIVLKALAKSPSQRYLSAEDLRTDISNYLNNLPVSARANTFFYRLEKTIRRHKIETAIVTLVLFLLIGWLATSVWQANTAKILAQENRKLAYSAEMILAATEYENTNLNRVNELVEKYKPNTGEEDLRGFEWYFLQNLLNPPSKITSFIHQDEVWNLEFSPDGKLLTTVSNDNFVRTWNIEKGETTMPNVEMKGAWKCAYFPDSKRFAVAASAASNPFVKVFEVETGKEILTLSGHTKRIRAVDVSPDGKMIATGSLDGTARIWNAETGEELRRIDFATNDKGTEINDVTFSKTGEKLAVVGFETLSVIDTKTYKQTDTDLTRFADKNVVLSGWKVAFSPLEKTLAVGNYFGEVIFLDSDKLSIIRVLRHHQVNVKTLAYSTDGKTLATGSWDRTVKFLDVQSGEVVNELKGHFAGVHELAYSPDGKILATASGDFNVNLWNAEQVSKSNAISTVSSIMKFSSDGKTMIGWYNFDGEISNYDLTNKQKIWSNKGPKTGFALDVSTFANQITIGERDGFISTFNLSNGNELTRVHVSEKAVYSIKYSVDGKRIFAVFEDGFIKAIDSANLSEIFSVKAHEGITKTLAVSPDGKLLASGGVDKLVKVFDTNTGNEIYTFKENLKPLYNVAFSADSRLLVGAGADDTARIWRISDGKLMQELTGMSAGIFSAVYSPVGNRLATASDVGIIRLWDAESGRQVLAFRANQKQISQLQFSDDGKTLMSVDTNGKLNFWKGTD